MNKNQVDNILFGIGCNSFNRFETFLSIADNLKGENYWYALRNAYTLSDNLYKYRNSVKQAFLKNEPDRFSLMEKSELKQLESLAETFTIYRAMTKTELDSLQFGVSWTLERKIAEFFANTYRRNFDTANHEKVIHRIGVKKERVIALFNDRKESEIIFIQ
jgi:hypothetical protein